MVSTTTLPSPTPTVTLGQEVLTDIHNKLHTIIFAHIGVIILFMALLAGTGYFGLKAYDKQLDRAQALQTQFEQAQQLAAQSQKQLADIIAADNVARAQETAQQQQIELTMAKRDAQAPPVVVSQALQPSAAAGAVVSAIAAQHANDKLLVNPKVLPDGNIEISAQDGQEWVSERVNLDRFSADYQSEVQLYTLETAKSTSLSNDLAQCQGTVAKDESALADAKKALAAYDKLAHRSKFRKILGSVGRNAERIGILAFGIEVGHKL